MSRHWHLRSAILAILVSVLVTGCAALRIDVDVYKGPLANNKEIQTSQFATLAIASKPLLIQVRNYLEPGIAQSMSVNRYEYIEPYFPDDRKSAAAPPRTYEFRNERALLVNSALSLYKSSSLYTSDDEVNIVTSISESIRKPLVRYEDALAGLSASATERDLPRDQLKAAFRGAFTHEPFQQINKLLVKYEEAYLGLLYPEKQAAQANSREAVQEVCGRIKNKLDEIRKANSGSRGGKEPPPVPPLPDVRFLCVQGDESANAFYDATQREGFLSAQRGFLFENPESLEARKFADRLAGLGKSFFEARDALHGLWWASVYGLKQAGLERMNPEFRKNPQFGEFSQFIEGIATIVAAVSQPMHLSCALAAGELRGTTPRKGTNLLRDLDDTSPGLQSGDYWHENIPRYKAAANVLKRALIADPVGMSDWLRAAIEVFRSESADEIRRCKGLGEYDKAEIQSIASRRYGLVRGALLVTSPGSEFDITVASLSRVLHTGSALGLERGRPREGLEELTQQYVDMLGRPQHLRDQRVFESVRARLDEALITFAQKIAFIADHQALLDIVTPDPRANANANAAVIMTLQTVGNTIIAQADDLRNRQDYERRAEAHAPAERVSAEQAFLVGSGLAYEDLLLEIRSRSMGAARDAGALGAAIPARDKTATDLDAKIAAARLDLGKQESAQRDATKGLDALVQQAGPLVHAYRTLLADSEALRGYERVESNEVLRKDMQDLSLAATSPAKQVAGPALRDEIVAWLTGQRKQLSAVNDGSPRVVRLVGAFAYLTDATGQVGEVAVSDRKTVYSNIVGLVRRDYLTMRERLQQLAGVVNKADDAVKTSKNTLDTLEKQRDVLTAASSAGASSIASAQQSRQSYEDAREILVGMKDDVLRKAKDQGFAGDPARTYGLIRLQLRDQRTKETDTARLAKLANTDNVLAELAPSLGSRRAGLPATSRAVLEGQKDVVNVQKDVMDDVIAALRYQLIEATAAGATPRAEQLEKAIKKAYDQRGGMAYLRPGSAYLRSVYTASALQPGSTPVWWENMLSSNSLRSIPFFGERNANRNEDLLKVQEQFDKQFWQNINSVRLAGGGKVNYVVAKDDVGNWYVKAYESDPSTVYKAAKGMLLFNLGGEMDMNLLRQDELRRTLADEKITGEPRKAAQDELDSVRGQVGQAGGTALSKVHKSYRDTYDTSTGDDHRALRELLDTDKLQKNIQAAWDQAIQGADKATLLEARKGQMSARTELIAARTALKSDTNSDIQADEILAALKQIRQFSMLLAADITRAALPAEIVNAKQTAADDLAAKKLLLAKAQASLASAQATAAAQDNLVNKLTAGNANTSAIETAQADQKVAQASVTAATILATQADDAVKPAQSVADSSAQRYAQAVLNRDVSAQAVQRIVLVVLNDFTERRIRTVQALETADSVIGQASK